MIHHSAATTANYSYDARERCTKIESGSTLLADYTWLGNAISKRETTCDYPGSTKPKFRTDFQRDGILRVSKVDNQHLTYDQATSGYNDLGEFAYTYDSASNPLTETQNGAMDELDVDRTFGYDTLHRLITALVTDTQNWTAAAQKTSWYSYDDLGNRISKQYRDAAAIGYQHDKANRMTTLAGLTQNYDKAGNQTMGYSADRGTSYVYRYDHHNRLTGVYDSTNTTRKAALTYDGLGRRIEVINDVLAETNRYYYDGVNEIVEYDGAGNRSRMIRHGRAAAASRWCFSRRETGRGRPGYGGFTGYEPVPTGRHRLENRCHIGPAEGGRAAG